MGVVYSKYAGGKTTVQVDTQLTTGDDGKTVYGDTRIAERHDPVQIAEGVSEFEAYHNILQDCYDILSQLTLKRLDASIGIRVKSWEGAAPDVYASEKGCAAAGISNIEVTLDPENWSNESVGCLGTVVAIHKNGNGTYHAPGGTSATRYLSAFKITITDLPVTSKICCKIKYWHYFHSPQLENSPYRYSFTIQGPGGTVLTFDKNTSSYSDPLYAWVALDPDLYSSWNILGQDIPYLTAVPTTEEDPGEYLGSRYGQFIIHTTDAIVAEFDWDLFDDEEIWERDITRAVRVEQDPAADDDPPEPDPPEFYVEPILYDTNYDDAIRDGWDPVKIYDPGVEIADVEDIDFVPANPPYVIQLSETAALHCKRLRLDLRAVASSS